MIKELVDLENKDSILKQLVEMRNPASSFVLSEATLHAISNHIADVFDPYTRKDKKYEEGFRGWFYGSEVYVVNHPFGFVEVTLRSVGDNMRPYI